MSARAEEVSPVVFSKLSVGGWHLQRSPLPSLSRSGRDGRASASEGKGVGEGEGEGEGCSRRVVLPGGPEPPSP
jgi:hypothetical protein